MQQESMTTVLCCIWEREISSYIEGKLAGRKLGNEVKCWKYWILWRLICCVGVVYPIVLLCAYLPLMCTPPFLSLEVHIHATI